MSFIKICLTAAMVAAPAGLGAQQTLTLDQCREMAVSSNKALEQAGINDAVKANQEQLDAFLANK